MQMMGRAEQIWSDTKFFLYKLIYGTYYKYVIYIKARKMRNALCILNSEQTIKYVLEHRCSLSRFGDGEMSMIAHYLRHGSKTGLNIDTFPQYDERLAKRLLEVVLSDKPNCLVCLPYLYKKFSVYKGYERFHFEREFPFYMPLWEKIYANKISMFGDACLTRFWHSRTDIADYGQYIHLMKQLWDNRDVTFLEGEKSRLGVGNDLVDNVRSIQRFLLPPTNPFSRYDEIIAAVKRLPKDRLYLLALGHTATVLAYDMAQMGFQAMDVGHVDIEYEWMLMGAKDKVAVPNKYVNELPEGRITTELDDPVYLSQIIGRIK